MVGVDRIAAFALGTFHARLPADYHVAILVKSVERSAERLRTLGFPIGPTEKWAGEGTLEIYVGESDRRAKLLLMEPYQQGAYSRALSKRGPGLTMPQST